MKNSAPAPTAVPRDAIDAAAIEQAKRFNLVCDNGQIVCPRPACGMEATLPTLLCAGHLAAFQRGCR